MSGGRRAGVSDSPRQILRISSHNVRRLVLGGRSEIEVERLVLAQALDKEVEVSEEARAGRLGREGARDTCMTLRRRTFTLLY